MNAQFRRYARDVARYRVLGRDEEKELAVLAKAGNRRALDRLVTANLRIVVKVAMMSIGKGVPLSDLVNSGNLGLITAAKRFDPSRGVKFCSYAVWWIRQYISKALLECSSGYRPTYQQDMYTRPAAKADRELSHELGRHPTRYEVHKRSGVTVNKLKELETMKKGFIPVHAPIDRKRGARTVGDTLRDPDVSPAERSERASAAAYVRKALGPLDSRDRQILEIRFGLDGSAPASLKSVSERVGVTRERCRQLQERALSVLRKRIKMEDVC